MAAIECPYCRTMMNLPLKFCVSCGRPVSASDIKRYGGIRHTMKAGTTKRLDDSLSASSFDRSKRSYRLHRGLRQIFLTISYVLLFVIVYYVLVRFILTETGPGADIKRFVEQVFTPEQKN